jgi:hypothetical protein
MRLTLGVTVAMVAMVVLTSAAPARTPIAAQTVALKGIKLAVAKGRIDGASAATYRAAVNRAALLVRSLPKTRSTPVSACLTEAAAMAGTLTAPRARAVFGQLAVNNSYFAINGPPAGRTDITDADGVVYRYFSGRGFQFHPLANFAALNARVSSEDIGGADRLARALIARGVSEPGGGMGWEYYFDYSGGRAPWLSGMAQAVAAQALSRYGASSDSNGASAMVAARRAFRSIPGRLVQTVGPGPWIRLYSFNRLVVLNAQLQSIISLKEYVETSDDADAAALVASMGSSAAASLNRFDTGYWTYYALPSKPSPLSYQRYVVQLLKKLAPDDSRFSAAATKFSAYEKQPPAFELSDSGTGAVRFWLSKPATVEMRSAVGATKRLSLYGGWYALGWKLPKSAGTYSVSVSANDWAGNRASFTALPIVRVVTPPSWVVVGSAVSQSKAIQDAAETSATSMATAVTGSLLGQPSFAAGAGLDSASQVSLAGSEGLNAVRLSVPWPAGASVPDPAFVTALQSVPAGKRLIVEMVVNPMPSDATGRAALAAYARSLVQQVPGIRDLLLGPAPVVATTPNYVVALGSIYDAVKPGALALTIAGELDGAASPKATLASLAEKYIEAGRSAPLMDELAFLPAPVVKSGAWTIDSYSQLVAALGDAFDGSDQVGSTLPILEDGIAAATEIPVEKVGLYPAPGPLPGVAESAQASAYDQALRSAVCMPNVSGVIFRRLVDYPVASDQSGLFYADGSAKTSAASVRTSALSAARGTLRVCPGLGARVVASTLAYPLQLSTSYPPQIVLACTRDCLYLITLERVSDSKPVLARRGSLSASTTPTIVKLSQGAVLSGGGSYRLRVRLVARINPGPIQQYTSPLLTAG